MVCLVEDNQSLKMSNTHNMSGSWLLDMMEHRAVFLFIPRNNNKKKSVN